MSSSSPSSSPAELVAQWLWRNSKSQHDQQVPSTSLFHESLVLKPLTVLLTEPGRFVCSFRVPAHLTNSSQVLHQGVIASLVDNVGAAAFITLDGKVRVSVDLNVSYVSPAHIDDEVEIEAKVLKYARPIGVVAVDLTNKTTGQLIAQELLMLMYHRPTKKFRERRLRVVIAKLSEGKSFTRDYDRPVLDAHVHEQDP